MLRQRVLQRFGRLRQEIFYVDKDENVEPSDSPEQSFTSGCRSTPPETAFFCRKKKILLVA